MSEAGPPLKDKAFRDLIKIVSQLEKRITVLESNVYSLIEWREDKMEDN